MSIITLNKANQPASLEAYRRAIELDLQIIEADGATPNEGIFYCYTKQVPTLRYMVILAWNEDEKSYQGSCICWELSHGLPCLHLGLARAAFLKRFSKQIQALHGRGGSNSTLGQSEAEREKVLRSVSSPPDVTISRWCGCGNEIVAKHVSLIPFNRADGYLCLDCLKNKSNHNRFKAS